MSCAVHGLLREGRPDLQPDVEKESRSLLGEANELAALVAAWQSIHFLLAVVADVAVASSSCVRKRMRTAAPTQWRLCLLDFAVKAVAAEMDERIVHVVVVEVVVSRSGPSTIVVRIRNQQVVVVLPPAREKLLSSDVFDVTTNDQ